MNLMHSIVRSRSTRLIAIAGLVASAAACTAQTPTATTGGASPEAQTVAATANAGASSTCPAHVRVVNTTDPEKIDPVDVEVNGKKDLTNVEFRGVSKYMQLPAGKVNVKFFKAGTTDLIAEREFIAAPNMGYTVAATAGLKGPSGQQLFEASPFVVMDDLTPPNPGKWKGKFYRFSETAAVIDFRIFEPKAPKIDAARISDLVPKTAIDFPELQPGTYSFNPVLPDKSDLIMNDAFSPVRPVEVKDLATKSGEIVSVIATGNALGTPPNSLQLVKSVVETAPPDANGCLVISQK